VWGERIFIALTFNESYFNCAFWQLRKSYAGLRKAKNKSLFGLYGRGMLRLGTASPELLAGKLKQFPCQSLRIFWKFVKQLICMVFFRCLGSCPGQESPARKIFTASFVDAFCVGAVMHQASFLARRPREGGDPGAPR
jgi:hypothetical protein